jgi:hypothetical protein
MNRTLIATVLSVCLVSGFGISQASADELKGLISVTQEAVPSGTEALAKADELIARRGGGGARRGGGMRRGGGVRRGGGRASTARRSGGSNARRGNAGRANSHSNVRRSNGGRSSAHRSNTNRSSAHRSNTNRSSAHRSNTSRSSAHRSNTSHSQHASNSRSNHANHSSQKSNSKGNNKSGKNGKNSQANRGNRTNGRDGNRGGGDGGAWDGRGWDGRGWDGDAISPIDPVVPVVPVDPIYVGPRPVITLLNPAGTGASLNYTLGEAQYVIAAGETTTHDEGTQEIAFDRGSSFGEARYTLQPGTAYKFVSTDHGWDLNSVAALAGTDSSETTTAEVATTHSSGASALTLVSGN